MFRITQLILFTFCFSAMVIAFSAVKSFEKPNKRVKISPILTAEKQNNKQLLRAQKCKEWTLPPIYFPDPSSDHLTKDAKFKRILLEKYFLLLQKEKLDKIKNSTPRVQELKQFIQEQLKLIERQLRRNEANQFDQDLA